jgi:hypothetical protein
MVGGRSQQALVSQLAEETDSKPVQCEFESHRGHSEDGPEPEGKHDGGQVRDQQRQAGKFRFHLQAPNGEIIAASQGYEMQASAE